MPTLYQMTAEVRQLYEMFENEEIDEQTFNDTVEGMGVLEKVEGYCQIIKQLNADSSMFKAEIDRLTSKKKTLDAKIKWLKEQLLNFYVSNGSKQLKAGTFTVSSRKTQFVDIPDESKIPKKYCIVKVVPDKTAIKAAISKGIKVKGASVQERESVQIK